MGYSALVERNIDKAFKLIGDLANTVTLVRKADSFNFSTLNVKSVELANLVTLAVITVVKKPTTEHNVKATSMILKTKEVGDINLFDTVIVNSETYKIGPVVSTDGFLTMVEIFKEG